MRLFVLTLMLSLAMPIFAIENLIVRQSTGDTSYPISTVSHITFPVDGRGIVLNFTDGTSKSFARGEYVSVRFNSSHLSGAEMIGCDEQAAILYNAESAVVSVVGVESMIKVYAHNGALIAEGENEVCISHAASGVYVVKAGSLTSKIVKQ